MNNIANPKIKILFVAPSLDAGGAEKFLLDLIANLNKQEFAIKLVLFSHAGFFVDKIAPHVEVKIIKKRFKIDLLNFCRLYYFIKKNKPDIIHTQLGGDVYGRLIAKMIGVRTVVSTEVGINENESFPMRLIKIFAARFATRIVGVSEAVCRDVVKRYLVAAERVSVIYNGLDVARFSSVAKKNKISEKIIFGGLGRLAPEKNWPTLLRAIAIMKNKNIECLIGGSGEMESELKTLVLDLGLKKQVIFLGLVSDVPAFMSRLDFFVLPSQREAFGIVLIEAGALGLPVIAAAVGGIVEVIKDNETGFLFNPRSTADLAEKLDYVVDNIASAEIKNLGLNLQNFVRDNFDIKSIAVKYENLYKELHGRKD